MTANLVRITSFWCVLVFGNVLRLRVMVTSGGGLKFCSVQTVTQSGPPRNTWQNSKQEAYSQITEN